MLRWVCNKTCVHPFLCFYLTRGGCSNCCFLPFYWKAAFFCSNFLNHIRSRSLLWNTGTKTVTIQTKHVFTPFYAFISSVGQKRSGNCKVFAITLQSRLLCNTLLNPIRSRSLLWKFGTKTVTIQKKHWSALCQAWERREVVIFFLPLHCKAAFCAESYMILLGSRSLPFINLWDQNCDFFYFKHGGGREKRERVLVAGFEPPSRGLPARSRGILTLQTKVII